MNAPRITPGGRKEIGWPAWVFTRLAARVTGGEPPHVFTTLARTRGLFWGWLHFAGRLMPGGVLPRRETGLVILRVAEIRGCDYERRHHRRLGRRAGLSHDEIDRVAEGAAGAGWSDRERMLLGTTDVLVRDRDLDDDAWSRVRDHLTEREAIELLLLVGHYDMLATTLIALRVQPDRG